MHVIGTAGHVDHGKSTLVQALTDIDPDRLKEEKEREMTIDLGFAWMDLPDGERVSFVDVPGHIDFVKNMLAGVGGIDAALFVVAADEGVMPQTREHLAILDLLQVSAGVVALTKTDLIDEPEWLDLVQEEVRDVLARTCLADAPIIPVSARVGQGLPELVAALEMAVAGAPQRRDLGRPRLPIDRVFTIAGFGTVVTGTLNDGAFKLGQEVEIIPSSGLKARIRGLQSHGQKIEEAVSGGRVAVNLTGVDTNQLRRGQVVTLPGRLRATTLVDVHLQVLPDAPGPLKHNAWLDFFSGAAEVQARLRLLDVEKANAGGESWVQLQLAEPVALLKGDRFILRQPSPSQTVGGGVVVNPAPGRRHRRFRPEVIGALERLAHGTPAELLLATLERLEPMMVSSLLAASTQEREETEAALQELLAEGQVRLLGRDAGDANNLQNVYLFSRSGWSALMERLGRILDEYHRQFPLRRGMPREELKSRLQPRRADWAARLFNNVLTRAASEGGLAEENGVVRRPAYEVRFSPEQQTQVEELLQAFQHQPYTPPVVSEAVSQVGMDVLLSLVEQGKLVRVSEEVILLPETYQEMVNAVKTHIQQEGSIALAQLRDRFQTSRKYALALLEHLDEQRVTRRVGDARVLR